MRFFEVQDETRGTLTTAKVFVNSHVILCSIVALIDWRCFPLFLLLSSSIVSVVVVMW